MINPEYHHKMEKLPGNKLDKSSQELYPTKYGNTCLCRNQDTYHDKYYHPLNKQQQVDAYKYIYYTENKFHDHNYYWLSS